LERKKSCVQARLMWPRIILQAVVATTWTLSMVAPGSAQAQDRYESAGVVMATREAQLSSSIAGKIEHLTLEEGDSFEVGDVVVEFDCQRAEAELRAAQGSVDIAGAQLRAQKELQSYNAGGTLNVEVATAELAIAEARRDMLSVVTEECIVRAPFSGRVLEKLVNQYEMTTEGQPMLRVFDDTALNIELIVPSIWLRWLRPGARFDFTVIELDRSFSATVASIAAAVDPVSQSVNVWGQFDVPNPGVQAGMSGRALFQNPGE